jgi:hypothetical protein
MNSPKWTKHQLALLLRAFEGGATRTQIADIHNITTRRVAQLLAKAREKREPLVLELQRSDGRDCLCAICVALRSRKSPK